MKVVKLSKYAMVMSMFLAFVVAAGLAVLSNEKDKINSTFAAGELTIVKTASPNQIQASDIVTYTYTITNTTRGSIVNIQLVDSELGSITCPSNTLSGSASMVCTDSKDIHVDTTNTGTVTGNLPDEPQTPVNDSDDATVRVFPTITVTKTANPTSITESGSLVEYTITVTNNSQSYTITLSSLLDDIYGNLNGVGTCVVSEEISIGPGNTYSCAFEETISCDVGDSLTDTVTAEAEYTYTHPETGSDITETVTDSASATVNIACEEEPVCGDGNLDSGEECDDGNTTDGDGCSATCTTEGEQPGLATIHGKVYNDANQNEALDIAEPGLANVTVILLDDSNNSLSTDQTDASGDFSFDELDPGTYALRETDPAGYLSSTSNDITDIEVAANDSSYHLFGDYQEVASTSTTPTTPTTTPTTTSALPTTGPGDNPYPLFALLALLPLMAAGYAFYSYKRK